MNRKVLLAGLAIAIPVIVLLFVSLGRDPQKIRSPLVGRMAPAFTLREAGAANRLSVEALRGTPVVLNFWATYCIPCIAEHGLLTQASSQLGSRVRFVGVVYDDREDRILDFLRTYGSGYPTLVDEGGKTAIAYGVYGVPETFFLDAAGKIVAKFEGPLTPELLSQHLAKAMGGS